MLQSQEICEVWEVSTISRFSPDDGVSWLKFVEKKICFLAFLGELMGLYDLKSA